MSDPSESPRLQWRWADPPVDRSVIESVAEGWGINFPADYIDLARLHHGGQPDLYCFDIPGRSEAVFRSLLSFTKETHHILKTYNSVRDRMVDRVFPFADDPFGNRICFDYRGVNRDSPTVVYWNHEVAHSDPAIALKYVCDSFSELIGMLHECD